MRIAKNWYARGLAFSMDWYYIGPILVWITQSTKGYGAYEHTEIDPAIHADRCSGNAGIVRANRNGAGRAIDDERELEPDRRSRGHRHPRQLARIPGDQARGGRRRRRSQRRGRRQVPGQESRRGAATRA